MTKTISRKNITTQLQLSLTQLANNLADVAASTIVPLFRTDKIITESKEKNRFDPVTQADKAAELSIREILAEQRPEDGILGEEYGKVTSKSGLTWVLDPIDGTRAFISGSPTWGILIALSDIEGPFLGLIDQPYIGERYIGGFGRAKFKGPQGERSLKTRRLDDLSETILFTTFPAIGREQDFCGFRAVHDRVKFVRYGMDCYAYALLASGHIDLVIEAGLKAYDIQAPIALIEAAGGIVTNWRGDSAQGGGQAVAASNIKLLEQVLPYLKPFAD